MKSHSTILAIVFGFMIINYFLKSSIIDVVIIIVSGLSLLFEKFSIIIEKTWFKINWIVSLIVPNIILSLVFYLFLTPISILSKLFKYKNDYKTKNTSDSNFIISNRNYKKNSFEKPW